jgi:hypothetical protein
MNNIFPLRQNSSHSNHTDIDGVFSAKLGDKTRRETGKLSPCYPYDLFL